MMSVSLQLLFFFFNDTATTEIYTLSLHDALPIFHQDQLRLEHHRSRQRHTLALAARKLVDVASFVAAQLDHRDRKSTRLNSSHQIISYAVFCLKKKKKVNQKH